MIELEFQNVSVFSKYWEDQRSYFFDLLVDGVKKSYENNLLSLIIARVSILEKECITIEYDISGIHVIFDSNLIIIDIQKQNWIDVLKLSLKYYLEFEEYEKCSYVSELLNKMC
jgi:hypothetical protein